MVMAEETKITNVTTSIMKDKNFSSASCTPSIISFRLQHDWIGVGSFLRRHPKLTSEKDAFTRANLNSISEKLVLDDPNKEKWSPLSVLSKPHHNPITGNYDINVLISALEERGKTVVWHDRRHGASTINLEGSDDILMGVVINIPVRRYAGLRSRHWVTLRKIAGIWYNLESG